MTRLFPMAIPAGLLLLLLSCGLPSYAVLDSPTRVTTGETNTLAFIPATGVDYYVLAYKVYWDNETSLLNSNASTIGDTDEVSTGYTTLKSLSFIQMCNSASPGTTSYPGDSTSITLEASGGTVTLTFDGDTGELSLTNAYVSTLYRRVRKVNSSGTTTDSDIEGKSFLMANYDYQDEDDYDVDSVTIPGDGDDGIDSDIYYIFDDSRFYGSNYDGQSLLVAVAVYSYSVSASAEAIESIPVYLGYVTINPQNWDPNY